MCSPINNHPQNKARGGVTKVIIDMMTAGVFLSIQVELQIKQKRTNPAMGRIFLFCNIVMSFFVL
jgi:hypothetical protein